MNNFQKIKSMSIDEMADFIYNGCNGRECIKDVDCYECIKQWLLQECE